MSVHVLKPSGDTTGATDFTALQALIDNAGTVDGDEIQLWATKQNGDASPFCFRKVRTAENPVVELPRASTTWGDSFGKFYKVGFSDDSGEILDGALLPIMCGKALTFTGQVDGNGVQTTILDFKDETLGTDAEWSEKPTTTFVVHNSKVCKFQHFKVVHARLAFHFIGMPFTFEHVLFEDGGRALQVFSDNELYFPNYSSESGDDRFVDPNKSVIHGCEFKYLNSIANIDGGSFDITQNKFGDLANNALNEGLNVYWRGEFDLQAGLGAPYVTTPFAVYGNVALGGNAYDAVFNGYVSEGISGGNKYYWAITDNEVVRTLSNRLHDMAWCGLYTDVGFFGTGQIDISRNTITGQGAHGAVIIETYDGMAYPESNFAAVSKGFTITGNEMTGGCGDILLWTDNAAITDSVIAGNKFVDTYNKGYTWLYYNQPIQLDSTLDGTTAKGAIYGVVIANNDYTDSGYVSIAQSFVDHPELESDFGWFANTTGIWLFGSGCFYNRISEHLLPSSMLPGLGKALHDFVSDAGSHNSINAGNYKMQKRGKGTRGNGRIQQLLSMSAVGKQKDQLTRHV